MDEFAFQLALASIWEFIGVLNRYVDSEQPWALAKDPAKQPRLATVLNALGRGLYGLGIVLAPFLPEAAAKIRGALGVAGEPWLADAEWGPPATGTAIAKLSGLFPRIDERKSAGPSTEATAAEPSHIAIADFRKTDLRVAEIVAAEAVPKSKKLLKLTVSLGDEQRTIVAGIAEHYAPADLVGKKVVVVANLEPAKLMGVESKGMLL